MTIRRTLFLLGVYWIFSLTLARAEDGALDADEQVLKDAGLPADGAGVLQFFRDRLPDPERDKRVAGLIRRLGARSFRERERASRELVKQGPAAVALLEKAVDDPDPELSRRARECLRRLDHVNSPVVASAAVRLLAKHRPPETARVLLDFLPLAGDEELAEEVCRALAAVAVRDGKAAPALVDALRDRSPVKRGAAGEALARAGAEGELPAVRRLLKDDDPRARLRVALALARRKEKEAVPVLIDLLAELPPEEAWRAEDLLVRLAGDKAPAGSGKDGAEAREKYRDAWRAWWKHAADGVDLAVLGRAEAPRGYTLVVLLDKGTVRELDRDGKPRWEIGGLGSPLDAQVLPGRRVLITEHSGAVTERKFSGEVVWEKKLSESPIRAERLPDGRTFIVTRKRLLLVDRSGKEKPFLGSGRGEIISARRFRDGRVGCVFSGGKYVLFDSAGKERGAINVGAGVQVTSSLETLPNGNILICEYGGHRVLEYTPAGKVVWQAAQNRPLSAVRLPNGNTLVSSQDNVLAEFDRTGKKVGERKMEGHPTQIRRR